MEESGKNTNPKKSLRTIVEPVLSLCIDRANELRVTKDEFVSLAPTRTGFVLVYYR